MLNSNLSISTLTFGTMLIIFRSQAFIFSPTLRSLRHIQTASYGTDADDQNNGKDLFETYTLHDESGGPYAVCKERYIDEKNLGLLEDELKDDVSEWYPTSFRQFEFGSTEFFIRETTWGCGRLGSSVWPAAIVMGLLLTKEPEIVRSKKVLELGSGVGLPSIVCRYALGTKNMLATDYWDPTDLFSSGGDAPGRSFGENLYFNLCQGKKDVNNENHQKDMVQRLDWSDLDSVKSVLDDFGTPDIVIGSDLVYYPHNLEPLYATLKMLMEQCPETMLVLPLGVEREALPEFTKALPKELSDCKVESREVSLHYSKSSEKEDFIVYTVSKSSD